MGWPAISPTLMRTLASPKEVEHRSSTTLREKPVKVGATVVRHGRYVTFRLAEGAVPGKSTARYKTMGWVCLDDEKPGRTGFRIRPDYQNRTVSRLLCRRGGFPSLAACVDGWEGPIMTYAIVTLAVSILAAHVPARADGPPAAEARAPARDGLAGPWSIVPSGAVSEYPRPDGNPPEVEAQRAARRTRVAGGPIPCGCLRPDFGQPGVLLRSARSRSARGSSQRASRSGRSCTMMASRAAITVNQVCP